MSEKNPFISYGRQTITEQDITAVCSALRSDWLTQGPAVSQFEQALCDRVETSCATVVNTGTAALHLTALALGWGKDDVVLTTPLSFLASTNSIVYVGATPEFVDIDPVSYTLDPEKLEQKVKELRSQGKKVKALLAVDFAGHPCDWKAFRTIADRYELQLVDDACHALGAMYQGKPIASNGYADASILSFHPVKHITTGEGGAILSSNRDFDQRVKRLRSHGMSKDPELLQKNDGPWYYEMLELGYNYRITDLQCALGLTQLQQLDGFITKRKAIAEYYNQVFQGNEFLITPHEATQVSHAWHLYPLQIQFEKLALTRTELFQKMRECNIGLQVHYIPIHLQPYYRQRFGFKEGDFPIAENFYKNEVSLPMFPTLKQHEMEYVAEQLLNCLH